MHNAQPGARAAAPQATASIADKLGGARLESSLKGRGCINRAAHYRPPAVGGQETSDSELRIQAHQQQPQDRGPPAGKL